MNAPEHFAAAIKAPPHNIEAEQSVIGGLMIDNDAIDRIGSLEASHFYNFEHKEIFTTIVRMITAGKPVDLVTLWEEMRGDGKTQITYLNALAQNTPSSSNINRYAEIVREKAVLRGVITLMDEGAEKAFASQAKASEIVDSIGQKLEALAQEKVKSEPIRVGDSLYAHVALMEQRMAGKVKRIPTGLDDLDAKLGGGLEGGELVIVAGRPAMGKTAFSLNLSRAAAHDHAVLFLSMEMPLQQLNDRLIASVGRIPLSWVREASDNQENYSRYTHAVSRITDLNLMVDDAAGLTLLEIRAKARLTKRKHGLDMMVIDYLGLMSGGDDLERHDLKIASYTKGLKQLAKEMNIPIVLLAQLNRGLEQRHNKRPMMSDLRDSGAIEQDADMVLFLYRDEYYHPETMHKGIVEVIIGKQRQGETGTVGAAFLGQYQTFENLAHPWQPPAPTEGKKYSKGFE